MKLILGYAGEIMHRLTLVLLLFASLAATGQQRKCEDLVPQMMEVSGLNQQLAASPEVMRQVTSAQMDREGSMPLEAKRAFQEVMLSSFDVTRLSQNVKSKLLAHCDPALYSTALEQIKSPLGQKMLQLEVEPTSSPAEAEKMQRYIASFSMQSPRESRMALIHQLMEATHAVEDYTDEILDISIAMTRAMVNLSPSKEQIAEMKEQTASRIEQMFEARLYYIYRSVPDEELRQYVDLQSSQAQQRFTQDEFKAVFYAMSQEAAEVGAKLRKVALEQRQKHSGE